MRPSSAALRLLLVGGGHAHLSVLEIFARHPRRDIALTLISAEAASFYSGMVPGVIAGYYRADEARIPLAPLAAAAGARFINDEVTGLDLAARTVERRGGQPLPFDRLSLDIGSSPARIATLDPGAFVVPAKPVEALLDGWARVCAAVCAGRAGPIAILGGGLGGIELALAMAQALRAIAAAAVPPITLATREEVLAATLPTRAQRMLAGALREAGVAVLTGFAAERVAPGAVTAKDGRSLAADVVFLATHAQAAPWLAATGLALDPAGFVLVDAHLRSQSHPFVFAAGDTAAFTPRALPKSGVVAVRQGRALADHLWSAAEPVPPARYRPQRRWLSLVGLGEEEAVALRGGFVARGAVFWWLKQAIDRRFVARYRSGG
jgi:selenide,water dikinase